MPEGLFLCHIEKLFCTFDFILYLCSRDMTEYNPHMTIHKLFLNIKKRDVYIFV